MLTNHTRACCGNKQNLWLYSQFAVSPSKQLCTRKSLLFCRCNKRRRLFLINWLFCLTRRSLPIPVSSIQVCSSRHGRSFATPNGCGRSAGVCDAIESACELTRVYALKWNGGRFRQERSLLRFDLAFVFFFLKFLVRNIKKDFMLKCTII